MRYLLISQKNKRYGCEVHKKETLEDVLRNPDWQKRVISEKLITFTCNKCGSIRNYATIQPHIFPDDLKFTR
jgi:hypothetical protein